MKNNKKDNVVKKSINKLNTYLDENIANEDIKIKDYLLFSIKLNNVRVNREEFLLRDFNNTKIPASYLDKKELKKYAIKLLDNISLKNSAHAFISDLGGVISLPSTLSADLIKSFSFTLKIIQELYYLYHDDELISNDYQISELNYQKIMIMLVIMYHFKEGTYLIKNIVLNNQLCDEKIIILIDKYLNLKLLSKANMSKSLIRFIPVVGGVVSGSKALLEMKVMTTRLNNSLFKGYYLNINDISDDKLIALLEMNIKRIEESNNE
ncbi:MAG: hypothetical protein LBR40_05215 [Bacilli bacterium]|jgi:hypothetical protein|nr:hypothetical protein [Bacilli bacterium]